MTEKQITESVEILNSGKLAVFATDTVYGIQAKAIDQSAIERLYKLRERDLDKPFIVLIASLSDLEIFNIDLGENLRNFLNKNWPNKLSVILPCTNEEFTYLHRGSKTLAFRMPDKQDLIALIKQTGPLVSTSVNPQGLSPAKTILEAKEYFGEKIDLYIDEGFIDSPASTIVKVENDKIEVLRQGEVKID